MTKRRYFQRPLGLKRYKKLFVISVEGAETESQYFGHLKIFEGASNNCIKCLQHRYKSSPSHVLKRMQKYIKEFSLKETDEVWLVVDKDQWTSEQLIPLYNWSLSADNYGFAISNPKFEYWLLLHFENGIDVNSSQECSDRLAQYFPEYEKHINTRKISLDRINQAIKHAKARNDPSQPGWSCAMSATTVYKLVEKILNQDLNGSSI